MTNFDCLLVLVKISQNLKNLDFPVSSNRVCQKSQIFSKVHLSLVRLCQNLSNLASLLSKKAEIEEEENTHPPAWTVQILHFFFGILVAAMLKKLKYFNAMNGSEKELYSKSKTK